jgi:hypothetical protein
LKCFFWFPHLKIAFRGQTFSSNEENLLPEELFCIEKCQVLFGRRWEHRWEKCVELQGDYVEKWNKNSENMSCIFVDRKLFRPPLYFTFRLIDINDL